MTTDGHREDPALTVARIDASAERRVTPVGDGDLVWRLWGAGPPLVLMHGASGSWTHWIRNIEPLARRFRLLVPDMPGFGDSAMPPAPATVATLAESIAAGIDVLVPRSQPVDVGLLVRRHRERAARRARGRPGPDAGAHRLRRNGTPERADTSARPCPAGDVRVGGP
jgi:hypothetical protein